MPDKHPLDVDYSSPRSAAQPLRLLLILFAVLLLSLVTVLFTTAAATKAPQDTKYKQDLSRHFVKQETVELDPATTAERVRREGRLSLVTPNQVFDLELTPHDLRATAYRAEETIDGGVMRAVERGPVRTFKGTVRGLDGGQARFRIDDDHIEGMILTNGERHYVEPASRYSTSASKTDFVIYKASDMIEDAAGMCGTTLDEQINTAAKRVAPQATEQLSDLHTAEAFIPFRVAEIATEADYEYVTAVGGSVNANNDVLGTMNYVEGIYERQLGITFDVVYQHTWATADDPYSATESSTVLREFTNHWNANFSNVARDLAHMWTGKTMNGNVAGIAYIGTVCRSPERAYGVSQQAYFRHMLAAHEIAHNFGATHADGVQECARTIMQADPNSADFCQFSRDEITTFASSNSGCLSSTLSISGRVTDASGAGLGYVTLKPVHKSGSNAPPSAIYLIFDFCHRFTTAVVDQKADLIKPHTC